MLTSEILKLESENVCSERFIVFLSTVLQRDSMVRKGADIKRLLSKRLDMLNNNQFDQFLSEFERCAKRNSKRNISERDWVVKVFTRLMLKGQLRAAVRWLTEHSNDGVMSPSQILNSTSITVMDTLKMNHPESRDIVDDAYLSCDNLPPLVDLDITGEHVENVA